MLGSIYGLKQASICSTVNQVRIDAAEADCIFYRYTLSEMIHDTFITL